MGLPFFSSRSRRRESVVAIDLGWRTTKAVRLQRRGERWALTDFSLLDAPSYEKGFKADALTEHLKAVAGDLHLEKNRLVTIALGVNEVMCRQVELPLVPVADMRQMLRINSKNYLQQDLPDYVFDCHIMVPSGGGKPQEPAKPAGGVPKNKVMVGGARKALVDELQAAARGAGLTVDQIAPGAVGPVNAFECAEPEAFAKEVLALVEIGFNTSSITILNAGEIALQRMVSLGGERLTTGLVESMGIGYEEAESIKIGMPAEVQSNLEPLVHPLGRELRASIDFFEHQQDKAVSQAWISGGSARSEMIAQILTAELMVPCKAWNPIRAFELSVSPEKIGQAENVASQLSVAVGAALASF